MAHREDAGELRGLLDTVQALSHIGSWEWIVATGEVSWSPELYRIYGVEANTPITLESFLARIHPDERERIQREIQAVLRHPGTFGYRELIVRPDGSQRTLDTVGHAVTDADGAVVKLVGTCRDITDVVSRDERLGFYADVFEHIAVGLSAWQLDRGVSPVALRLVAFNARTEELVDRRLGGMLGRPLAEIVPALAGSALLDEARAIAIDSPIRRFPPFLRSSAPSSPWLAATLFPMPARQVGLALEDVTAQVRTEMLHAAERRALEMLASGEPLAAILGSIVRAIEQVSPGTIASVLLLDETGTIMKHGAAPGLPDAYNRLLDGHPIGPRTGSCGTAMFRRERVIAADIETDPLWEDYRDIAREHGLRACWSHPLLGNNSQVLGAFALYHREPCTPDDAARELLSRAAHVTGIVIERRALDEQLRALAGRIESAREDERTTIARDIHDQLGQALTALKLDIGWLRRRIDAAPLVDKLEDMSRNADEVLRSVRRISADLRPGVLDDLGLRAAIEWQAEEFERRTNTRVVVTAGVTDLQLERGLATNVFRIFQEALTNVARHASATTVEVSLALQQGQLHLEIADDGIGIPEVGPRGTTLGILGMRERAWRLGGECTVKRRHPHGTTVTVVVPLRFPSEQLAR
jgi:PAS domain S-box-containing protein